MSKIKALILALLLMSAAAFAQVSGNGLGSVFVNGRSTGYRIGEVTLLPSGAGLDHNVTLPSIPGTLLTEGQAPLVSSGGGIPYVSGEMGVTRGTVTKYGDLYVDTTGPTLYFGGDVATNQWIEIPTGGATGGVAGPASATDGAIAAFDGTTGKLLKNTVLATSAAGVGVNFPMEYVPTYSTHTWTGSSSPPTGWTIADWDAPYTVTQNGVGAAVADSNGDAGAGWIVKNDSLQTGDFDVSVVSGRNSPTTGASFLVVTKGSGSANRADAICFGASGTAVGVFNCESGTLETMSPTLTLSGSSGITSRVKRVGTTYYYRIWLLGTVEPAWWDSYTPAAALGDVYLGCSGIRPGGGWLYWAAFTMFTHGTATAPIATADVNGTLDVYGAVSVRSPERYVRASLGLDGVVTATSVTCSPTISSGTAAPTTTPAKVGDVFIDTTGHKLYFADCITSSTCWVIAN